ncbi:MAG: L-lactate permease [Rhodospirillales bacterium]|nr:L-lactate permease [Rhodospirillales bacterium]
MTWERDTVSYSTADFIFSAAPVIVLIFMMTKKNNVPSHIALPISALLVYGISLIYFGNDPNVTNATIVNGLLTAWVPIFIIWGAILLFKTMEVTGAMNTVRSWLNGVSPNPVAQLMIIGWAFAFLIEGASGFGTPAALAAPILVGLGFQPLNVACLTLVMNSVPVTFGAVGTPTWFGLGQLKLPPEQLLQIGIDSAIIHSVAALVIPLIALSFVVSWRDIRANIVFVYLSILSCVVPYLLIAFFNYEFPSLIGGMIGLLGSVMLARADIGLAKGDGTHSRPSTDLGTLVKAFFPLWGTVLVLIVTRIPFLGIKALLTAASPAFTTPLGSLGEFSISAALVVKLTQIFGTGSSWSFSTLYIPAFIPFFVVSFASLILFGMNWRTTAHLWTETSSRMVRPIFALLGALVMVKLMTVGGDKAMVIVIGQYFADLFGRSWQFFASYLGAIGAFFAGSNTVSNLMFAGIQKSIAETLGLNPTVIIAMQSVGGAMGNMVCINNIVAVCSLLGILNKEGVIIKRTVVPMIVYGLVAGAVGFLLGA